MSGGACLYIAWQTPSESSAASTGCRTLKPSLASSLHLSPNNSMCFFFEKDESYFVMLSKINDTKSCLQTV